MGFKYFATNVFLTYAITFKSVYADDDYITQLPINLYQSADITPQNADFDKENNKFIAHPGWYNDIEVHYYKFHINGGTSLSEIPIQDFYLMTTDGTLDGAVGNPIISYYNGGEDVGKGYSDYMNLKLVTVPQDYVADTYKSVGDITTHSQDATVTDTNIYMNIPVVPNDSTLQHPNNKSELAPINPIPVWYKGNEVHTYLFEVTDESAAEHFAYTRPGNEEGFEITVADFVNDDGTLKDAPIWFMNGYTRGVVPGVNGGGPDPAGHKNIIGVDRGDVGYSPIWRLHWIMTLPLNYNANEISNPSQLFQDGVTTQPLDVWVNCPNAGRNGKVNMDKKESFETEIDASDSSTWILGTTIPMSGVQEVSFTSSANGLEESTVSTETNGGGVYQYELSSCDIAPSATLVEVEYADDTIRTIEVDDIEERSCDGMEDMKDNMASSSTEEAPSDMAMAPSEDMDTMNSATSSLFTVGSSILAASVVSVMLL